MAVTYRGNFDRTRQNFRKYEMLGLDEIYLDYAGGFPPDSPIHGWLGNLGPGHSVFFNQNDSKIEIHDPRNRCVGRLSNKGFNKWAGRLNHIVEVNILAMLQRDRDDPDHAFMENIKAINWEIPVLELTYSDDRK